MMQKLKKIVITLSLFLLLMLLVGCHQESAPDDEVDDGRLARNGSYINEASEQLAVGNLELALANFEQAILHEEELALAWRGVGLIRFRQNQFSEARVALETALELGSEPTAILYHMLGVTAMRASDFQDAIDFFDAGIAWVDSSLEEAGATWSDLINGEESNALAEGISVEVLQSMMFNRILAHQNLANWNVARELASSYLQMFPDDQVIQREYEFLRTR